MIGLNNSLGNHAGNIIARMVINHAAIDTLHDRFRISRIHFFAVVPEYQLNAVFLAVLRNEVGNFDVGVKVKSGFLGQQLCASLTAD